MPSLSQAQAGCRWGGLLVAVLLLWSSASRAAVDVTGTWRMTFQLPPNVSVPMVMTQAGTTLTASIGIGVGSSSASGTIDPDTGVFTLSGIYALMPGIPEAPPVVFCNYTITATASADGQSFAGMHDDDCGLHTGVIGVRESLCGATARAGCATPGKSFLLIKDKNQDGAGSGDKLIWRWLKGPATTQADFGDPTATANYSFCLYAGTAQALTMVANVPADGMCASGNCWNPIGTKGYKYKDTSASTAGISRILLKGGAAGSAKIRVRGKDGNLDLTASTLPLSDAADVIVQLSNSDNSNCWQATFPAASVKKNTDAEFKARTP